MLSTSLHLHQATQAFYLMSCSTSKLSSQVLVWSYSCPTIVIIRFCYNRQTRNKSVEVWGLAIQGWYDIPRITRNPAFFVLMFYGVVSFPRSPPPMVQNGCQHSSHYTCNAASKTMRVEDHPLSCKGCFPELYTQTFILHCA